MAALTWRRRRRLPRSDFAIPERAPESGSYPIDTEARGRDALARVAQHGSPAEQLRVRRAVHRRYPSIGHRG